MFSILSVVGIFTTYLLPYDTIGMQLDNIEEDSFTKDEVTLEKKK